MFGLSLSEVLILVLGAITILQFIFKLVQGVRDPNVKQDARVQRLEDGCIYKHKSLDTDLKRMSDALVLIQENDLKHIENRMTNLEKGQSRLEILLEERLPRKQIL